MEETPAEPTPAPVEVPADMPAVAAPEAVEAVVEAPAPEAAYAVSAPAAIQLNATALTLGVKETFQLTPILPEGVTGVTFSYATSNAKIAPISTTGVITAKKKGTATVGVTASTGEQLLCQVTVVKAPKKITLSAASGTLGFDAASGVGTQYKLGVTFPKNTGCQVRFGGYDGNIVAVADDGTITARGLGTTTVTASTFNGKSASCQVTVLGAPASLVFTDPAPAMIEKEHRALALSVPEGTVAYASFASDNPAVATVNEAGEVVAVAQGACTITARAFNGVTTSCTLSVLPGPDKIVLPGATVLLGLGDQALLGAVPVRNDGTPTGTGLSYASSKTKYVTVAADGILTGKKKGSSVVTVTAANGVTAKCTVKVVKAPKSVKLSADKRLLKFDAAQGIADTAKLQVILPKNTASHIAYSGYDPAVVSVAADGTVTATGLGTTSITAATYNGKTDSFRVTVCAPGKQYNADVVNVAHRGGKGNWTENTVTAFQNTAATGARAVELDARSTKDGVQVVHHDATFTVGGKKYTLKKLTLAQIRALDPNICTLDEALDVLAGTGLEINLELKDTANAAKCVKSIQSHGLQGRTMYISFNIKQLKAVRKADGATRLGYIINQTPKNLAKTLKRVNATYVFQKADFLTSANLYDWQDAGLKVGVWTVNDVVAMTNWLAMGVDYITSDYPEQVTALLR